MDWITAILCYFLGAFSFIPLVLWLVQFYITIYQSPAPSRDYDYATEQPQNKADVTTSHNYGTKEGWVILSSSYEPNTSSIKRQTSGGKEGYGVFKQGILKIYNTETKQRCERTLDLNDYDVSIYPPGRQEHTLFSRSVALRLLRKQTAFISATSNTSGETVSSSTTPSVRTTVHDNDLFFTCTRPIDKEDWYFAFMSVTNASPSSQHRAIPFDPMAVASLISFVGKEKYQHQPSDTPIPWFNAVLGRTFLGIYKTHRLQQYVFETLAKKTLKMKTPGFLGDIQVRSVDLGYAIPFVTNPTLVELCPDGTLILDALVDYSGGFKVVVEANAGGGGVSFSIRVPLVLSLTLQSLSGTIRFKIKPPPSNRYWIGFCTMPTMKWSILPAVSNYNVKLSMVTKIIEAKIRRMMTENMVLPNMADIPFARSDGKGGIFHELSDMKGGDDGTVTNHADVVTTGSSSGDDDDGDNDSNDLNSPLRHSFTINDPFTTGHDDSATDVFSSSPASGRWSKFFATRRRKTNTMTPAVDNKSVHDGQMMHGKPIHNGQIRNDQHTSKIADQQNESDTHGMEPQNRGDDMEKRYHGVDSTNDTENDTTTSIGDFGGPMYLSPSGTASTSTKRSSAASLTTTAAESFTTTSSSATLGPENDAISTNTATVRSTPQKRIYNAAGYILSKGKGLANDLREHRQQDLLLKRQQSLLHYNDQLQDIRRRYNESTQQRRRRSSAASMGESAISHWNSSVPPLHLIRNNCNINALITPHDVKPPLPPRPSRKPTLPHPIPSNNDDANVQLQSVDDGTVNINEDLSPSSRSTGIPSMDIPPMIPTMENT
ncbi:putative integral membrane protein conserved region-domain-containing protein [Absidia repens]|uniref:Putative integral membrane protein conserved region-domain-containing protein n=1 Tax=Absidia repens TaxID=90262 RepID=A0A1X2IW10_9FUNG|nr:putative integral membrane protein conserved region-domain-containing protein [Absidia repens]